MNTIDLFTNADKSLNLLTVDDNFIEESSNDFTSCSHVCQQNLGPNYILHISATCDSSPYVASCLSNHTVSIHQVSDNQMVKVAQLEEHETKLIGCKFVPDSNQLLYTASSDGNIKVWDLRTVDKSIITFNSEIDSTQTGSKNPLKYLTAFDTSACNRLLAGSTELVGDDAYIFFWDIRNPKLLGAYWESHTDDITQLRFYPNDSNKLMSGSTDGLINIYNLKETSEDDALELSLNTDEHVECLSWFGNNKSSRISCITANIDLQLWDEDGAEPYKHIKRDQIAKHIKANSNDTYIVNAHYQNNFLWVIAGAGADGNTLRSFCISANKESPGFRFDQNSQRVRTSWWNDNMKSNLLLTGGENGNLDIWRPNFNDLEISNK